MPRFMVSLVLPLVFALSARAQDDRVWSGEGAEHAGRGAPKDDYYSVYVNNALQKGVKIPRTAEEYGANRGNIHFPVCSVSVQTYEKTPDLQLSGRGFDGSGYNPIFFAEAATRKFKVLGNQPGDSTFSDRYQAKPQSPSSGARLIGIIPKSLWKKAVAVSTGISLAAPRNGKPTWPWCVAARQKLLWAWKSPGNQKDRVLFPSAAQQAARIVGGIGGGALSAWTTRGVYKGAIKARRRKYLAQLDNERLGQPNAKTNPLPMVPEARMAQKAEQGAIEMVEQHKKAKPNPLENGEPGNGKAFGKNPLVKQPKEQDEEKQGLFGPEHESSDAREAHGEKPHGNIAKIVRKRHVLIS